MVLASVATGAEGNVRVAHVSWVEIFAVFVVSHLVGDYLLQTDWQATQQARRAGQGPVARRALLSHIATYTLAFVPALIWLAPTATVGARTGRSLAR